MINLTDEFIKRVSSKRLMTKPSGKLSSSIADEIEHKDIPTLCELVRLFYAQFEAFANLDPDEIESDPMLAQTIVSASADVLNRSDELSAMAIGAKIDIDEDNDCC